MKIAALITTILALGGPPGEGPPEPEVYRGSAGQLTVATPRVDDARIGVDGVLDEAAWEHAALLTDFTQYDPSEGLTASQPTEVLLFVTADALYVGVRARESDPAAVRATLSERDEFTRSDDYVRLVLDTFADQRRAYVFTVNPLGVQHDGLWIEGRENRRGGPGPPIDDNQDFVWESNGRITPEGWVVEIKIPFKSLRFPDDRAEQAWGLNVMRRFQRTGFEESWAPLTGDVANQLVQSGRLAGLRDLDAGLFLEVNPVLTGKRVGAWDDAEGRFRRDAADADFGVNATYGITSNLTLDATYNPDFSQVEADAGQIAVNERFAFFFPEKRPFFLEGTEIFQLPKNLIYTRSIVDPVAGAKLTGKVGGTSLGYLGAVDRVGEGDAVVNLLRARRDLGTSSSVGALYTDRTRGGGDYNRVAGADARVVLARRYTLTFLGAASFTAEPDEDPGTGSMFSARFERAGRGLSFNAEIEDVDPDFRAESGFLRRLGETQLEASARANRYGAPGAFVERWGPSLTLRGFWDHDAFWRGEGYQEAQAEMGANVSFRNNVSVFFNWTRSTFDAPAASYEGLRVAAVDGGEGRPFLPDQGTFAGLDGLRLFFWVNAFERVRGNARLEWRETPIFERSLGVPVETADGWSGDVSLNLFPTRALKAEVGVRHESLTRKVDGSHYSSATIPRVRLQYQFSRALFVRSIVEYASQEQGALVDPLTGRPLEVCRDGACQARSSVADHDVHVEALVSYEPSPGTVMYLGYSRDMADTERFRFRDVEPRADGLFAKVSYRFRF